MSKEEKARNIRTRIQIDKVESPSLDGLRNKRGRISSIFAVAAALKKHQSLLFTLRTNGTSPCAMAAMTISCPTKRSRAKHHNDCAGFLLGKRCIKIVILRYEAIGDLSICKALHDLSPRDNYYVKLVLRCFICLRDGFLIKDLDILDSGLNSSPAFDKKYTQKLVLLRLVQGIPLVRMFFHEFHQLISGLKR